MVSLSLNEQVSEERAKVCGMLGDIQLYRNYALGNHQVTLTSKQKTILRNLLNNQFCDNVCHQIIFEASSRLKFEQWRCPTQSVSDWLQKLRSTSRIRRRQSDLFYDTLRDGNAVMAVNWDNASQSVKVYREEWWNGNEGIYIAYDIDDEPRYGVKEWVAGPGIRRRILWDAESLVRLISNDDGQSWSIYNLPSDPVEGVIPWIMEDSSPIGLPYIHLTNGARVMKNYGTSELFGGVIGFQDQINDLQYAMSAAGRLTAFQMYYGTGVKMKDDQGNPIQPQVGPGAWFSSTDAQSKFGAFPTGDLSQLINLHDKKLRRVAQMTQTPYHTISGGDWPSGDALLRAELPAVAKARRQLETLEEAFVTLSVTAIKINNRYGKNQIPIDFETAPIEVEFADPENRDIVSRSSVVHNMATSISKREAMRILGIPETRIEGIINEMKDEMELTAPAPAFGSAGPAGGRSTNPNDDNGMM